MTDIVEEARALLAGLRSHPWRRDRDMVQGAGCILVAKCIDADAAGFIAASPRLLAALADECERLRADLARVTAERDEAIAIYSVSDHQRDEACRDRDRAMAERDTARADIAVLNRALADERAAVAIAHERIAEVTAERDARPEISREDAAGYLVAISRTFGGDPEPYERTMRALRAHAAGSGKGGNDA